MKTVTQRPGLNIQATVTVRQATPEELAASKAQEARELKPATDK